MRGNHLAYAATQGMRPLLMAAYPVVELIQSRCWINSDYVVIKLNERWNICLLLILQVMISLSSDEVMLVASTFLESSTWLLVMLLESLSLCQQDTAGRTLKTDAQIRAVYPLIDVVQLTKNCSTLRVVTYLWGCFNPDSKDYRPMMWIFWSKRAGYFRFSTYDWFTEWPLAFKETI